MEFIDGKSIAKEMLAILATRVAALPEPPRLCDIVVGEDPVSESYVRIKARAAEQVGIRFFIKRFSVATAAASLEQAVAEISRQPGLSGLIIQLPLPAGLPRQQIIDAIDPRLDADCLTRTAQQHFYAGLPGPQPPAAAAIIRILDSLPKNCFKGNRCVVVGRGDLVGRPTAFLLAGRGWQVTSVDRSTDGLRQLVNAADLVVSGTGQAGLITASMIRPGAVIIDAGTSESQGAIVGDVDPSSMESVAGYLTPVPGGVGPVTVAELLGNVVTTAELVLKKT